MTRRSALKAVSEALQGRVAPDVDWMELLGLANEALVTPGIYRAFQAAGALEHLPPEAATFMADVTARNDDRNARLLRTAADAIAALNGADIQPTLLKGMALRAIGAPTASSRMTSDIDLLVRPEEVGRAGEALRAAGFNLLASYPGPSMHVVAEFGRPTDVGLIDLHQRPPGPPGMVLAFDVDRDTAPVAWNGRVRVPSAAHQIFLMCVHDQFHDGDYWRGALDFRHLLDIAELTRLPEGVDWDVLDRLLRTRLLRNAVHTELVAAHRLADARVPDQVLRRLVPRLQHRRRLAQHFHPRFSLAFAGLGLLLEWTNIRQHRAANRAGWKALLGATPLERPLWWGVHPDRIKGIMRNRAGKV